MCKSVVSVTFILLVIPLARSPLPAQSRHGVDEVIKKAVDAMGGLDRIYAVHRLIFKGFNYEGSYKQEYAGSKTSNATMVRMRPDLRAALSKDRQ